MQRALDCDMVLVHDDDLRRIDGIGEGTVSGNSISSSLLFSCCQPLESLEHEVVLDHFRRSNIEVHMVRHGESSLLTELRLVLVYTLACTKDLSPTSSSPNTHTNVLWVAMLSKLSISQSRGKFYLLERRACFA
jgi:hypothetical protein